jgi:hypothetical protein
MKDLLFQRLFKQFCHFENVESQFLWLKQQQSNEIVTSKEEQEEEEEEMKMNAEYRMRNIGKYSITNYQSQNVINYNRTFVQ